METILVWLFVRLKSADRFVGFEKSLQYAYFESFTFLESNCVLYQVYLLQIERHCMCMCLWQAVGFKSFYTRKFQLCDFIRSRLIISDLFWQIVFNWTCFMFQAVVGVETFLVKCFALLSGFKDENSIY